MDTGLLSGIAGGLSSLGEGLQRERENTREDEKQKRQLALALAQSGLVEKAPGVFQKSDDKRQHEALERATSQAGLLKSGFKADYDQDTGEYGLTPVKGFKDTEKQLKDLQLKKLEQEMAEGKKPASNEFTAAGFANRVNQAENVFKDLKGRGYDPTSTSASVQKMLPDFAGRLKGENARLQEQAERNFVNAVLRRESGAAIAQSEFENAEKQYFPRPGDTEEVLNQKEINRKIAGQGLAAEGKRAMAKMPVEQSSLGLMSAKKSSGLIPDAVAAPAPQEQDQAIQWAKANMNDPRAKRILQLHGIK